jgi:hypothetical protein
VWGDFSEAMEAQRQQDDIFKLWKEKKNCQQRILYLSKGSKTILQKWGHSLTNKNWDLAASSYPKNTTNGNPSAWKERTLEVTSSHMKKWRASVKVTT